MERLSHLQAHISNLRELRSIFHALRALAATHIQEAQNALVGVRTYVGVVEDAISDGVGLLSKSEGRIVSSNGNDASVLIVVCSEHGFAGAFNRRLLDRAESELTRGQNLVVIGSHGALLAAERGLVVEQSYPMATRVGDVLSVTRRIADYLATTSSADIVYGSYQKGGGFDVESQKILPLDTADLTRTRQRSRSLTHLAPEVLLRRLAGEYLFAEITRSVTESLASENAARLVVMEAADHNIDDKLRKLGLTENVLRQEAITSELLDVVTGSEAVLGN